MTSIFVHCAGLNAQDSNISNNDRDSILAQQNYHKKNMFRVVCNDATNDEMTWSSKMSRLLISDPLDHVSYRRHLDF